MFHGIFHGIFHGEIMMSRIIDHNGYLMDLHEVSNGIYHLAITWLAWKSSINWHFSEKSSINKGFSVAIAMFDHIHVYIITYNIYIYTCMYYHNIYIHINTIKYIYEE